PRIVGEQPELGRAVVVGCAQPAVHCGADVALFLLLISAAVVSFRHAQPLFVPAVVVAQLHAARRLEDLAHRAAALLRLAQRAAELVRPEEVLRPVVPAEGFVMRFFVHVYWGWKPMSLTSLPYLS